MFRSLRFRNVIAIALLLASAALSASTALPPSTIETSANATSYLPGRETDARVARIAFRLAVAGRARCPALQPTFGLVLQHLSQFRLADRPGLIATEKLDRGPEAIAIVPGSPADRAGLRPGDVLLSVDGARLPSEDGTRPFDPVSAHTRADAVEDLLTNAATKRLSVAFLRSGRIASAQITPLPACPSRVSLARSEQRNAYADGRHVLLTTGLVARTRSDDELAFILAHEMAHNIRRHAAVMRSDAVGHGLGRTFGKSGRTIREIEREADALGGEIMIDAGYDPVAGAAVLDRVGTDLGIALFATHDTAGRRIAAMRAIVASRTAP